MSGCKTAVVIHNLAFGVEYQFQVQAVVEVDGDEFFGELSSIAGMLCIVS